MRHNIRSNIEIILLITKEYLLHPFILFLMAVCLYTLYQLYLEYKRRPFRTEWFDDIAGLGFHRYRLNNKWDFIISYFVMIITFILIVFPFFMLRIYYLSADTDLINTNPYMFFSLYNIIYLILAILCMSYYLLLLHEIFYKHMFRLFTYYYSTYPLTFGEWVISIYSFRFIFDNCISSLSGVLYYILEKKARGKAGFHSPIRKYCYIFFKNKPRVLLYLKWIYKNIFDTILHEYRSHINVFLSGLPNIMLLLILIYDIQQKELHYLHYALLLYALMKLYTKFMNFISNIELCDYSLGDYFYKGIYVKPVSAEEFQAIEAKITRGEKLTEYELDVGEMSVKNQLHIEVLSKGAYYVTEGFKSEYAKVNGNKNEEPYLVWPIRRFWMLIFSIAGLYYSFYYREVSIIVFNITLPTWLIIIALIPLLLRLWYITGYKVRYAKLTSPLNAKNYWRRYGHKYHHRIFWILSTIIISFTTITFLQVNFYTIMADYIINTSSLKIMVNYTIEEKIQYIFYLIKDLYISQIPIDYPLMALTLKDLLDIMYTMEFSLLIDDSSSLEIIKENTIVFFTEYYVHKMKHATFIVDLEKAQQMIIFHQSVFYQVYSLLRNSLLLLGLVYNIFHVLPTVLSDEYILTKAINIVSYTLEEHAIFWNMTALEKQDIILLLAYKLIRLCGKTWIFYYNINYDILK